MRPRGAEVLRLQEDYLARLRRTLTGEDGARAAEIERSVEEHIDEALAEFGSGDVTPAQMANVLDRLGPPEAWARESERPAARATVDASQPLIPQDGGGGTPRPSATSRNGRLLALWGVVLSAVALIVAAIGVARYCRTISVMLQLPPETVVSAMQVAMGTLMLATILNVTGTILMLVALWASRYRAPWFRVALWILAILWLSSFPVGTVLGVMVIVYLVKHKQEFVAPTP